jgi:hypothetical protein
MRRYVSAFGRFWWDFVIGDDWRIAACVVAILAVGAVLVHSTHLSDSVLTVGGGIAIVLLVVASIVGPALTAARR